MIQVTSGPNFPLANGCLIPCLERCVHYAFDAVEKIRTQNIKSLSPSTAAVNDFQEHKDSLMKDLVWTSECRSWYKNGEVKGKVWGPWPGSSLHFLELMSVPRWEDWEYEYLNTGNRFEYLGKGKTEREEGDGTDLAWYVSEPGSNSDPPQPELRKTQGLRSGLPETVPSVQVYHSTMKHQYRET